MNIELQESRQMEGEKTPNLIFSKVRKERATTLYLM